MKPNKFIAVFSLLNALAFCLTHSPAGAGQGDNGGQAKSHMSSKGAANTNAQWSADPERGWVRAEERHDRRESDETNAVKKNGGKQKGARGKSDDQKSSKR